MAYWNETDTTLVCQSLTIGTSQQITNISEPLIAPGSSNEIPSSKAVVDYVAGFAPPIVMTTKGDLVTRTNVAVTRLGVGADTQVLTADALTATGLKWAAVPVVANVCDVATTAGDLIVATAAHTYGRLGVGSTNDSLTVTAGSPAWSHNNAAYVMSGVGDLLTTSIGNTLARIPIGTSGHVMTAVGGTTPAWAALPANVVDAGTTNGDLIQASGSHTYGRLAIGAANTVLYSNATTASWSTNNSAAVMSGVGDLLTTATANTLARIPIGTAGQVMTAVAGTTPAWANIPTYSNPVDVGTTAGDLVRASGSHTYSRVALGTEGYVLTAGAFAPTWEANAMNLMTTKGDFIGRTSTTNVRVPIGSDSYVLTANSGNANGLAWQTPVVRPDVGTTIGDLISVSNATGPVYSRIAASTSGYVMTANGAGVLPSWQANPVAVGSAIGDIIYVNAITPVTYTRLVAGTANYVLTSGGAGTAPSWAVAAASSIPNVRMLQAEDWDIPVNSGWPITGIAGAETDPTDIQFNVRRFVYAAGAYGTGAGFKITVPSTAANLTLKFWGRALSAPGGVTNVSFRFYVRRIPDDAVSMIAWAYNSLADLSLVSSSYWQANSQTRTLAQLGITAGQAYHVELTRQAAGSNNLLYDYLLNMLTLSWT